MKASRRTPQWKHCKKIENARRAAAAKERPRNRCQVCWGFKGNSCDCHMYEWGPCIDPETREIWCRWSAWFLKGHVGERDFYASC